VPPAQVALEELPPGVSPPAAEAVLFIGKAVRALKQPMSAAVSAQALAAHARVLGFSEALRRLQREEEFSAARFELCVEGMRAQVTALGGGPLPRPPAAARLRAVGRSSWGGLPAVGVLGGATAPAAQT
jgi:gamma-tubulin complex component 4